MIILVSSTELDGDDAIAAVREAVEAVGGAIVSIDTEEPGAARIDAAVPGMGIPALGGYLASGGVQLEPSAETVLAGASAGVHASTLRVTIIVRLLDGDTDE